MERACTAPGFRWPAAKKKSKQRCAAPWGAYNKNGRYISNATRLGLSREVARRDARYWIVATGYVGLKNW